MMDQRLVVGFLDDSRSLLDNPEEIVVCVGYFIVDCREVCTEATILYKTVLGDSSVYGMTSEGFTTT